MYIKVYLRSGGYLSKICMKLRYLFIYLYVFYMYAYEYICRYKIRLKTNVYKDICTRSKIGLKGIYLCIFIICIHQYVHKHEVK